MTYAIEAQALSKRYASMNGMAAISELNLSISTGQLFGLVGPDGAGKTTTLRILSTVLRQTSGQARVAGFDVRQQAEQARRRIGYMPQNFSLYPDMSVLENLRFFADLQRVTRRRQAERLPAMLDFTRLARFQDRRAGNLSGGMKKKLALACALVHEPQVLLLDEPSTGVDPVSRRELWLILSEVVQQGVTVLVSTPYMDEADRCHQVGILYQGRLLTSGAPTQLQNALPFEILEVKAMPRKAIRALINGGQDGVLRWRPVGDRLRLSVTDLRKTEGYLRKGLRRARAEVSICRPAKATMEDVFIHLVETQREAQ